MPRPPDQPTVLEDTEENAARERTTVRELYDEAIAMGWRPIDVPLEELDFQAILVRIGPKRWAELRARRDEILEAIRAEHTDHVPFNFQKKEG